MASVAQPLERLEQLSQAILAEGLVPAFQARILRALVEAKHHKLLAAVEVNPTNEQRKTLLQAITTACLEEQQRIWHRIFEDCSTLDAKKISKTERTSLGINTSNLIYGEVSFMSLGRVFWGPSMKLKPGGTFVDLGSGSGRGVFAAALLHDFDRCIGVEVLEGLHSASLSVLKRWQEDVVPSVPELKRTEVSFVHANFLDYDWSDADVVFANSTCFDDPLMKELAQIGEKLKIGTYFITLTKALTTPYFLRISSKQYKMSWGLGTVHVHIRCDPASRSEEALLVEVPTDELAADAAS